MGFKDEMEQYDEQFDVDRETGGKLPDGKYSPAVITESRMEHDSEDDTYTAIFKFTTEVDLPDGRTAPKSIRKWYNLDNEIGRSITAQDMKKLGYEGKLSELEKACEDEQFIGLSCEITVKTKPGENRDFTNVYIDRVLGKLDADSVPTEADDDIPF